MNRREQTTNSLNSRKAQGREGRWGQDPGTDYIRWTRSSKVTVKFAKRATIVQHEIFDRLKPSGCKWVGTTRAFDPLQIEEVDHGGLYTLKLSRKEMFINDSFQHTHADTICHFPVTYASQDRALDPVARLGMKETSLGRPCSSEPCSAP